MDTSLVLFLIFAATPAYAAGGSLLWSGVNFFVLMAILIIALRKPLSNAFSARHDTIKGAVHDAETLRAEVERMFKDYEAKLAKLDEEVKAILAAAREEGEQEKMKILDRANKNAERIRADAELSVQKELARMREAVKKEVLKEAVERAAAELKKRMTEKDHRALHHDFIRNVESIEAKGGART